jgi:hypothetical protein
MPIPGETFSREVRMLLELSLNEFVDWEPHLSSKKPDLVFTEQSYGKNIVIGVECKDWESPIGVSEVANIHAQYLGLLEQKKIDVLLIVSRHDLTPQAATLVSENRRLRFQTIEHLHRSLIDFSNHLFFTRDHIERWLATRCVIFSSGKGVSEAERIHIPSVCDWVVNRLSSVSRATSSKFPPPIVLGAYGIGKTTLAYQVFRSLMARNTHDRSEPIPLYIPLNRLQHEQSIEGLLASIFTSHSSCRGYSFSAFLALNQRRKIALIFDGIDEMRHRLTWDEFAWNMREIDKLTSMNPCSIVLGRPTVFMSNEEYETIVKGKKTALSKMQNEYGGEKYTEIELLPFDTEQVSAFVANTCRIRFPRKPNYAQTILRTLNLTHNRRLRDICSRPVHLQMLLDVFPGLARDGSFDTTTIFMMFTEYLIEREREKQRVRGYSNEVQRGFAQRIAWWLWRKGSGSEIEAERIDNSEFLDFVPPGADLEGVRRGLIASSFLSTEGGTRLHFPHRSLQEFLVAEHLCSRLTSTESFSQFISSSGLALSSIFTLEVSTFLGGLVSARQRAVIIAALDGFGELPETALKILTESVAFGELMMDSKSKSRVVLLAGLRHALDSTSGSKPTSMVSQFYSKTCGEVSRSIEEYAQFTPSISELDLEWSSELSARLLVCLVLRSRFVDLPKSQLISALTLLVELHTIIYKKNYGSTTEVIGTSAVKRTKSKKVARDQIVFGKVGYSLSTQFDKMLDLNRLKVDSSLDISWMYKVLRRHLTCGVFIFNWDHGESIRINGVRLAHRIGG